MKNKILSKAYGGVIEARRKLYGLGLPRQWKVITSTLLLLFTFAIGNVWAALTAHTPGVYEKTTDKGGYGATIVTVSSRDYEVYGFSYNSSGSKPQILWAGTSTNNASASQVLCSTLSADVQEIAGWISMSTAGKSSTYSMPSSTEFAASSVGSTGLYQMKLQGHSFTIKVKGYDQFSFLGNDNNGDKSKGKYLQVTINGSDVTTGVSSSTNIRRYDLNASIESTIVITGLGGSNEHIDAFSLRLPSCQAPTTAFSEGAYTVGESALALSSLISGNNSDGAISYVVKTDGGTGASIAAGSFTATTAGTATITATQAADATHNKCEKIIDFNVVVTASSCAATIPGDISKGALTAGEITLTADGSAESGDIWYWQDAADGTATNLGTGATKNVNTAGTYYIRSYNTAGDCWSAAKSIEVTAEELLEHYAITYNKGEYGTGTIAGGEKVEGVAFTLSSDRFTRAGYVQVGWATTNGGAKAYDLGGSYTTDAEQEFFPVWAETSTYVASFDSGEGCSASTPAGWTFANAGSYGASDATADFECKFGENFPTSAAEVVKNASYIAFAKADGACATYDLGSATTVSALAGTFYVGSGSERTFTIEYLAANGTTVLHTISTTTNTNWGEKAVNDATVVPNVKYIRINPAHAGSSYSWLVMKAFSVTYVDLVTKYDLAFAKNGGSGADMATLRYAEDAVVTLPGCTFTAPTDKTFDAWVVTKTASGNPITVTDGKFTMPAEAVTATATWKFLPKLTLTAGEGATGDDVVAYYAATTSIPVPAKPEGFSNGTKEFTGWVYSSDVEITDGAFPMPSSDLTLTAQWASATAVAQILGGDSYETFAEAIAAVAAGQTIQLLADCSYDAAWNLTLAGTVTLDLNGHDLTYTGSGRGVQVHNGAKLVLEDGTATVAPTIDLTADPLSRSAITYTSGTFDSKDGMCALAGGEIEINSGTYLATEGVILVKGNGATATVNDGVLISRDNGVLMGNGTNSADFRNYVINVHGGILLGEIFSTGYASMVIYHPNVGELNIDGGTLVSTNGPAVVCRGGESNITGGTIIAQGSGSGKCGDASLVLQAVGVAYDFKSAYPGVSSFDAKISGDANVSGAAGAVQGIYAGATPTTAEKDAVAISGGTFNSPVAQALCAENYAPKDNGDGTYGVKPLATSIDFEDFIDDQGTTGDWATYLSGHGYAISSTSDVSLDGGEGGSKPADKGLKIKKTGRTITFEVAADKLVTLKVGSLKNAGASISVNGGAYTALESANPLSTGASVYTYYHSNAVANYSIKTNGDDYCIIQSIKIEDPYVVTYNATDGECATASAMYIGEALTLPTPTHATYSFKGWYDAATGGNLIGAAGAEYTPTASVTLYAQWEAISTVNTLSDLKVDGATIDGFDPATNIYYLVYEYGQQPVITSATATSSVAEVTINNTPVDEGTYKYVQVKVVPESGEADQKFYQVRYTNKLKRGVEIIKVETTGGNNKTVSGLYAGDGDVNLSTGGNARKMDEGKYIGFILDGTTLAAGDIVNVHTSAAATTGGSHIIFYDNMTDKNELYETGEIGGTGDNLFVINAAMEGSTTAYVYRSNADAAHKWNGFVDYLSAERYMDPFIESFKIGEAIGTIDKVNKTIAVEVPATADLEHLTPTIKAYANGGATLDKTGEQDFSSPVTYEVSSAYVEDGDVTYTVTVTKAAAIKEVIISGTLSVLEGETTTLSAAVYDTNDELASIQAVVWTVKSGDEDYASVDANGVVTGKAVGAAHIIATSVADDTKSAQVEVAISVNPCRVWSNPSTRTETITLGNLKVKPVNIEELKSLTPYSGAEAANSWKLNARDDKYAELYFSDGAQFDALTIGVTSNQAASETEYKYAVVFSTASGDGFDAGIIETQVFNAGYKDAAEALVDVVLPEHTRAVRIMRQHREGGSDLGGGNSVYLYYIRACKKELVPLTSVSLADMSLAVGVTGTPEITLNPAGADIASYAWSIISDETGVATIDAATGALSSTATGAVTVKVTVTDVLSNVRESNVATINIVNKYVDVVPVSETTTWSWSGLATADVKVADVDTVLANYFGGAEWQKIAGKAGNDQYAYRSGSSYDCYQGTYLYLKATVPGMLIIKACYASSGAKLNVNGHEIATLASGYTEYKVAVPAGNVKIEATGSQKMRIKTMTFDADLASYDVTENKYNGYTRDVTEGRYGTICLPNGGIMVGAELYEVAYYGATSEKIFFDEILNGEMVAGVPYIYLPNEGADKLAVFYTDEANESAQSANGLVGYIGASENTSDALAVPHNVGNYILNNNQYREVVSANSAYILSHRAYIHLADITPSEPALAPGRRRISMSVYSEQIATGIENTGFESEAPRKVLINGELFILRGEKMYDAKGQLVK